MAHVRVERLCTGDGQHDGAECEDSVETLRAHEVDRVDWVHGRENRGVGRYLAHAEHAKREKPNAHDRAERQSYGGRTKALNGEERNENEQRDRKDVGLQSGACHGHAFDRGEHGDRRRDHTVSVKQSRPEQSEPHDGCPSA